MFSKSTNDGPGDRIIQFAANAFAGTNHKRETPRFIVPMHPEPLYRTAKANMSPVQMRRVQT